MDAPAHAIKCLKSHGLHGVWLVERPARGIGNAGGELRIVKTWPLGLWMAVKLLLGIAQPQRQIRGVQRLQKAGVPTPPSYGSWRVNRYGGHRMVEIELGYAPGHTATEWVKGQTDEKVPPRALVRAARLAGEAVAKMANGGVFHRDLKSTNIVVDLSDSSRPGVWIIDTVGVRTMWNRATEIERMLERLALQPILLETSLARAMRMAALRGALQPCSRSERAGVIEKIRQRIQSTVH